MDYTSLIGAKSVTGSLADRINYALCPAPELIKNAQDEIFARLRVREMRKSLTINLAAGASCASLPSDFLDADSLIDPYGNKVKRNSDDRVLAARAYDSTGALIKSYPQIYGILDEAFQFDCGALKAITLRGMYYGATYIGSTVNNTLVNTNFLTNRYSNLFWSVLLKFAYAYRKDPQMAEGYASDAEDQFTKIEAQDDLSYRGIDDGDAGDRL